MFPSFNFSSTRSYPTRRTCVDAFGRVSPVASADGVAAEAVSPRDVGDADGDDEDDEIISQRKWRTTKPDFAEVACERIFAKEVRKLASCQ